MNAKLRAQIESSNSGMLVRSKYISKSAPTVAIIKKPMIVRRWPMRSMRDPALGFPRSYATRMLYSSSVR